MSQRNRKPTLEGMARRSFLARLVGGIGAAGFAGSIVTRVLPGFRREVQEKHDITITIHPLAVPRSHEDHPFHGD